MYISIFWVVYVVNPRRYWFDDKRASPYTISVSDTSYSIE